MKAAKWFGMVAGNGKNQLERAPESFMKLQAETDGRISHFGSYPDKRDFSEGEARDCLPCLDYGIYFPQNCGLPW